MSKTFGEIERKIRSRSWGDAEEYKKAYEADHHSQYDRCYSGRDAEDGADFSVAQSARKAFEQLEYDERRREEQEQEERRREEEYQHEQQRLEEERRMEQEQYDQHCSEQQQRDDGIPI